MPNEPRLIVEGACYHIMVIGNQKQVVFKANEDLDKYMDTLAKYKKRYKFMLYGYCLMPKHVRIVGEVDGNGRNLSKFMHGLNTSYVAYFNNKYQKVGHLWQGRFKSKVIVKDKYLIDCINYIELNPVMAGLVKSPHEYIWSSYKERNMLGPSFNILDPLPL